jgi:protein-S-isoprenylcysteine O-methyltransferase Ste14
MAVTGWILAALWLGWLAYWAASSGAVKATARTAGWQAQLAYSLPLWLAAILLINRRWPAFLVARFLPATPVVIVIGLALTAAGLAFAIWARRHLGANWSAEVTVKEGHELVRSGPYAVVRHPIYTGLTLAFMGTALAIGEWRGVAAAGVAIASFWYKLGIEERVMRETFGAEYDDYARHVKALLPYLV